LPCKYNEHLVCNRWLHIGLLDNILQSQSSSYLHQISFPTQLQFLHKLCQNYFSYNFRWSYYFICNAIYLHGLTFKIEDIHLLTKFTIINNIPKHYHFSIVFTMKIIKGYTRVAWQNHVKQDIRPYLCLWR